MGDRTVLDARVRMSDADGPMGEAEVKGILLNPSFVLGGIVDERTFIAAGQKLIAENGIADYLRNLLFAMMRSLTPHIDPHETLRMRPSG